MRAHEWIFECVLDADFPMPQRLHIQVFDDGTMTGSVEDAPLEAPLPAEHERRLFGKPAGFRFYVLDGSATWRDVGGETDARCQCRFLLMRFSKRLREGQLVKCEAELLPESHDDSQFGSSFTMETTNVRRCIRAYSQDLRLPAAGSLRLIEQRVTPSIVPLLWKLTSGVYTFKGFTCAVSEMLYECKLTLVLKDDGSVAGFSEDLIHTYTRKSKLHGYWSAGCVTFQLADDSGDATSVFVYSLAPQPNGLRGSWHEQVTHKRGYFQHGHAELVVESVRRHGEWSPSRHTVYPTEFQASAQECLHTARRHDLALPRDVWEAVLSNCAYDWF